ncbi:MAG: RdgB/HAM1 family non-canonical purine NTP pyrophosphatase [candidate division WOR-3 bacterium]
MRLLVATENEGKIREIKEITKGLVEILTPLDIGLKLNILEDGLTLQDNSLKKALTYFQKTKICTIGEDTGLFVKALGGAPGVYAARYGGSGDASNRKRLLSELKGKNNREAYFKTVIAFVITEKWIEFFEGEVKGRITEKEIGEKGFGYDSVFMPLGYTKTFGEMNEEEKNKISHRRIALEKLINYIYTNREKIEEFCK